MTQAIVRYQHFLDHHCRVSDVFFLVGHEDVDVLVDFLDEALELVSFY